MFNKIALLVVILSTNSALLSSDTTDLFKNCLPILKFDPFSPLEINFIAQLVLREKLAETKFKGNIFKLSPTDLASYLKLRAELRESLDFKKEERKKILSSSDRF